MCGDQPATTFFAENFESGLEGWTLTNQGVYAGWPNLNWTTATVPGGRSAGGRTGRAAFGADPDAGDCGQGAGDISGIMQMESPAIPLPTTASSCRGCPSALHRLASRLSTAAI